MDLDYIPTFPDAAGDATAAAPNATTTDVKPAKKYANKTVCWKKMFPDATETWAEVCNNKDDERVKKCEEEYSIHDKGYRLLKKAWDEAHPEEKAAVDAANANVKTKKGGNYGKKSKKRARKIEEDEDDSGLAIDLREYIRTTVYKLFQSDKKAYVERKQVYREILSALETGEIPVTEAKDDVDRIIDDMTATNSAE